MKHDFSNSDHCTNCGVEQYEGKGAYDLCTNEFNAFTPINLPIDMRNLTDRDNDAHWQAWRDGDLNDCGCSLCQWFEEQNRQDMENV